MWIGKLSELASNSTSLLEVAALNRASRRQARDRLRSVMRNPYLPSTTTTSPWAMRRPSSKQVNGRLERVFELNDDSGAERKHIAEQHAAAAEAKLHVETDIHEAAVAGRGRGGGRFRFGSERWSGGGDGLIARLQRGSEGGADLNFEGDGFARLIASAKADDGVRRPGRRG